MKPIVTDAPRLERSGHGVRVVTDVAESDQLWFEVDAAHSGMLSDRADHVAVGLLMPAMRYGRDLHVGGVMTDVLLHQLNGDLQALVRFVFPNYQRISVTADAVAPAAPAAVGVATGFSGGVDSMSVIAQFALSADVPHSLRLTHLLNNNVGAHGQDAYSVWHERCERLQPVAAEFGLPFVTVDSNLDAHYPRIGFLESASFRNAAVVHVLGAGIGRQYYASSYSYRSAFQQLQGGSYKNMGTVDAMALPLLSTPSLILSATDSGLSRVEKTLALIGRPEARHLDVCTSPDPTGAVNCSHCRKCMRTMLTLEIAGHLEEFLPEPFRRDPYLAHRRDFLIEVLASNSSLMREIVDLADERGWRWGAQARQGAVVRRAKNAAITRARELRNRLRRR